MRGGSGRAMGGERGGGVIAQGCRPLCAAVAAGAANFSGIPNGGLRRQIGRIERLALESYQSLLRKETLVSDLQINPENFDIALRDDTRDVISPEELSAGERQLLAISLLWGMAKASGRALPVAIDTPMGRLDSAHRARLVERYFPFVSHQTLLFSTDEEIAGDYLRRLRPYIGRSYRLDYDDSTGSTTATEGFLE